MRLHLASPGATPDFLDLPWEQPLTEWGSARMVEVVRGVSRHVVRFVEYEGAVYALKEISPRLARREFDLLRDLGARRVPVVEPVGVVSGRPDGQDAILITRHLAFSLPYRTLFAGGGGPGLRDLRRHLMFALSELLVRVHLVGFFWGDCSLSNALFRRDAGTLSAYLVDAETGERHPQLSDGQRLLDLQLAETRIAGDLLDMQLEGLIGDEIDPFATAAEVRGRYDDLWAELTRDELIAPGERHRIHERIERLHDLGYDTSEVELVAQGDGYCLRLSPQVVEPGHHARRLLTMTGLDVQENQARRLLHDLLGFREEIERVGGGPVSEAVAAYRWLTECYGAALALLPPEQTGKLDQPELYHQILEHRWFLSEELGRCATLAEAVGSYVSRFLATAASEHLLRSDEVV